MTITGSRNGSRAADGSDAWFPSADPLPAALPSPRLVRPTITRAPSPGAKPTQRSMAGYLTMPRPGDLFKAALLPLTFAIGALTTGHIDTHMCLRALVLIFALEFLIYPARYQWNDIRGFAADQRHPSAVERGRLPGPLELARQHISASGAAAIGRLLIAAALVFAFPG